MSQLLASLVDLTSLRDHDALDRRLLQLLAQALPRCDMSLYRCVGDPAAPRLLRQARLTAGQQGQVDAPWTAVDDLIALADLPVHQAAFLPMRRWRICQTHRAAVRRRCTCIRCRCASCVSP